MGPVLITPLPQCGQGGDLFSIKVRGMGLPRRGRPRLGCGRMPWRGASHGGTGAGCYKNSTRLRPLDFLLNQDVVEGWGRLFCPVLHKFITFKVGKGHQMSGPWAVQKNGLGGGIITTRPCAPFKTTGIIPLRCGAGGVWSWYEMCIKSRGWVVDLERVLCGKGYLTKTGRVPWWDPNWLM